MYIHKSWIVATFKAEPAKLSQPCCVFTLRFGVRIFAFPIGHRRRSIREAMTHTEVPQVSHHLGSQRTQPHAMERTIQDLKIPPAPPGIDTVTWDISYMMSITQPCIPPVALKRVVKELLAEYECIDVHYRMTAVALEAIHAALEEFGYEVMQAVNIAASHAGRDMILTKNFLHVKRLMGAGLRCSDPFFKKRKKESTPENEHETEEEPADDSGEPAGDSGEDSDINYVAASLAEEFTCPISGVLPTDPVIAMDGITYSKKSIEKWFEVKSTSPVTNLPISTVLVPNIAAKNAIEKLVSFGGLPVDVILDWSI